MHQLGLFRIASNRNWIYLKQKETLLEEYQELTESMWPDWKWAGTRANPEGREEGNTIIPIAEIAWPDADVSLQDTNEEGILKF